MNCAGCAAVYPIERGLPMMVQQAAARSPDVKQAIASYYHQNADVYEREHGIGGPGGRWSLAQKYVPFFRRHLRGDELLLELGAGTGLLTRELASLSRRVVASDIAPGMLHYGRAHNGLRTAVVADAERLPFCDSAFDTVAAMNALSYCVHKDAAISEVYRVLKPGGLLLLVDMNYLLHVPYHLLALKEWSKARLWTRQLLESTPWGWRKRLQRAGFVVVEQFEFNWVPHRFGQFMVERVCGPLDRVLSRIPGVRHCAMRIAIVARKSGA